MVDYRTKGKVDVREYIQSQYRVAYSDYKTARSENEQWEARKQMAKLEVLAQELYGSSFADSLAKQRK